MLNSFLLFALAPAADAAATAATAAAAQPDSIYLTVLGYLAVTVIAALRIWAQSSEKGAKISTLVEQGAKLAFNATESIAAQSGNGKVQKAAEAERWLKQFLDSHKVETTQANLERAKVIWESMHGQKLAAQAGSPAAAATPAAATPAAAEAPPPVPVQPPSAPDSKTVREIIDAAVQRAVQKAVQEALALAGGTQASQAGTTPAPVSTSSADTASLALPASTSAASTAGLVAIPVPQEQPEPARQEQPEPVSQDQPEPVPQEQPEPVPQDQPEPARQPSTQEVYAQLQAALQALQTLQSLSGVPKVENAGTENTPATAEKKGKK